MSNIFDFKSKLTVILLLLLPFLLASGLIIADKTVSAQTETKSNDTNAAEKQGEKCTVFEQPEFSITGVSAGAKKGIEITCDASTPYCDKKNKTCVQCLTPDIPGYDRTKSCETDEACIHGRCVKLETPLPALNDLATGEPLQITGIASYIIYIYNFGLRIAGVLAFLLIIIYGFGYVASLGNEQRIKDYREKLTNVFLGIIVLLGSYIILTTINPTLTQLREPKFVIDLSKKGGVCDATTKLGRIHKGLAFDAGAPAVDATNIGAPCRCTIGDITWSKENRTPLINASANQTVPYSINAFGCGEDIETIMGVRTNFKGKLELYQSTFITSMAEWRDGLPFYFRWPMRMLPVVGQIDEFNPDRQNIFKGYKGSFVKKIDINSTEINGNVISGNIDLNSIAEINDGGFHEITLIFTGSFDYCASVVTTKTETGEEATCAKNAIKTDKVVRKSAPLNIAPVGAVISDRKSEQQESATKSILEPYINPDSEFAPFQF